MSHQISSAFALPVTPAFATSLHPSLTPSPPPSLLLALFDPSAQVGDTLRTVIFGAVGIMVAFSALTVLYTQLVLPGQVEENARAALCHNDTAVFLWR